MSRYGGIKSKALPQVIDVSSGNKAQQAVESGKSLKASTLLEKSDKNYNIKSGTWIFECNISEKRLSELSNFKHYHIKKENGTISLIYKFVL